MLIEVVALFYLPIEKDFAVLLVVIERESLVYRDKTVVIASEAWLGVVVSKKRPRRLGEQGNTNKTQSSSPQKVLEIMRKQFKKIEIRGNL